MNRDDFFKAVLKQFFYDFVKNPATIIWDDSYNVLTLTFKARKHDCIIRIYADHYIMISSTNKGPFDINNFDIEEFKEKYKFISDEIPF
jgi:hypothetical protein